MTPATDFDSPQNACLPTAEDDARNSTVMEYTVSDNGDLVERETTSRQERLNTGSEDAIKIETPKHSSKPSHQIQTTSETSFLCKPLRFLRRRHGLVLASIAPFIFSIQSLLVDVLTETLDPFQVVIMHVPIMMICCSVLLIYKGVGPSREYKHYFWLLGSGTCQTGNTCFLALSMTYMAVGDTVTIMYTALIQVGFFSWLILREPVRLFDTVFGALAFGGVIFIARPPFIFRTDAENSSYNLSLVGVLYALAGSVCIAVFVVISRKLSKLGVDSFFCIFFNATSAVVLSGLIAIILNRWRCPTMREWLFALLAGVNYVFAHVTLFFSLKVETATLVTVISTVEIILAYLWQILILHISPFWTSYIGATMIFAACVGITVKNKQPSLPPNSKEINDAEQYRSI